MEKMKIDEFFKEKLTNLEIEFDEEVWNDLEKKLDKKKRRDRVLVWWWHWEKIAAVFVFGSLGYGIYHFSEKEFHKQNNQVELVARQEPKEASNKKQNLEPTPRNTATTSRKQENVFLFPKIKEPKNFTYTQENPKQVEAINLDRILEERNIHTSIALQALTLDVSDSLATNTASEENKKSTNISHTIGLAFSPVISPNGLQAGLGYTHEFGITERASLVSGVAYTPWAGTNNLAMANNAQNSFIPDPASNNIRLQTLEIPLETKIKITENLSVSSGISNTFLLQEKIADVVNNDFEWSISSLNVGVQYDIHIGKNSQLNLQPYYRFPLQSIGSAGTQISGFGLRAGYSYGKGKRRHRNTIEN